MRKLTEIKFECLGEECWFEIKRYGHGNGLRLDIMCNEGPMAVLSVNVPDQPMPNTKTFICKNYSENVAVAKAAWLTGAFKASGRTVQVGHTSCPIWICEDDIILE